MYKSKVDVNKSFQENLIENLSDICLSEYGINLLDVLGTVSNIVTKEAIKYMENNKRHFIIFRDLYLKKAALLNVDEYLDLFSKHISSAAKTTIIRTVWYKIPNK